MLKRHITVESPAGARVSIWHDEEGSLFFTGSATPELRRDPDKCIDELHCVFMDALGTYYAQVIPEEGINH